jgi:hypothetical protein
MFWLTLEQDGENKQVKGPMVDSVRQQSKNYDVAAFFMEKLIVRWIGLLLCGLLAGCAHPLSPREIDISRVYIDPTPIDNEQQIQRGRPRKVIDGIGWLFGIPGRILLLDRRIDNHKISLETEFQIAEYLEINDLYHTRVRLNQYNPREDWQRLFANRNVNPLIRFTFGTVTVLGETLLPGRIFGGDHYNPFTDTIHLYSDVPAIALHEGAHAKDFARRKYKGLYSLGYTLLLFQLYYERVATGDVFAFYQNHGTPEQHAAAARILYPAYGTYVGSLGGRQFPRYGLPIYFGSVLVGHAAGRFESQRILQDARWREQEELQPQLGESFFSFGY